MFNKVILVGRLGQDPELKTTPTMKLCELRMVTEKGRGDTKIASLKLINIVTNINTVLLSCTITILNISPIVKSSYFFVNFFNQKPKITITEIPNIIITIPVLGS